MSVPRSIPLESAARDGGGALSIPAGPLVLDRARPARPRLGERLDRGTGEVILMIGAVAVAGPVVAAVAGVLALLALSLAGPWLSLAILSVAYALIVLVALAVSG